MSLAPLMVAMLAWSLLGERVAFWALSRIACNTASRLQDTVYFLLVSLSRSSGVRAAASCGCMRSPFGVGAVIGERSASLD
jgi:hypothetical protein